MLPRSPGSSPINPSISCGMATAWSHAHPHPVGFSTSKMMHFTRKKQA